MANTIFKGFKQVLLADYNKLAEEERKGYLWLVREAATADAKAAIYFGNRKYAELNNEDERAANLVVSLGEMVDANGQWLGFLPVEEHEILGEATDASDAISKLEAAILSLKARVAANESAITEVEAAVATKAEAADLEALESRVAVNESAITEIEEVTASALTNLDERVDILEDAIATKAEAADLEVLEGRVAANESAITALEAAVDTKANAEDVYTKNEVYNKEEIDGKISGTFKFMGDALRISEDKTKIYVQSGETEVEITAAESNRGNVYQIDEKEYASNGAIWVELGFNIDLSDYAKKEYVDSAITAESAAREEEFEQLDSALTTEVLARQNLAKEVEGIDERVTTAEGDIVDLGARASFTADTFDDVVVSAMTLGQIVYVANGEESGRTAGAYIKVGDTLKKLDTSSGQGDTPLDRIESLENKVGTTAIPEGKTVTEVLASLITVTGGDVEE